MNHPLVLHHLLNQSLLLLQSLLQLSPDVKVTSLAPGIEPAALPGTTLATHGRGQLVLDSVRSGVNITAKGASDHLLQIFLRLNGQRGGEADKRLEAVIGILQAGLQNEVLKRSLLIDIIN